MEITDILISLIAGSFMLMVYSFLYRDSRWFHFAEHLMVGSTGGYAMARSLERIYFQGIQPIFTGSWWFIIAVIVGLMFFARWGGSTYGWMVRIPSAFLIAAGIGLNVRAAVETQITPQIVDTIRSITTPDLLTNINNILLIIGVISVAVYFIFSKEATGAYGQINKVGRCFLMVAFGSSFAYALLGRTSLLISRMTDMLSFPIYILIPIACAMILYDIIDNRKKS